MKNLQLLFDAAFHGPSSKQLLLDNNASEHGVPQFSFETATFTPAAEAEPRANSSFYPALQSAVQLQADLKRWSERAQSARDILTHVIRTERYEITEDDNEQVLRLISDRKRHLREQMANIEAFERSWLSQPQLKEIADDAAISIALAHDPKPSRSYWKRVRHDLQTWFPLTIEELAKIIGIAKATLFYIDDPARRPRPSTLRKVMELHGLAGAVIDELGDDRGRTWLAHAGLAALRSGGVPELDRAVVSKLYGKRRSEDAVTFGEGELEAGPYEPDDKAEARAF